MLATLTELLTTLGQNSHRFTFSKNDVISSVRIRYCALGLWLELGLGLVEIRFRSNMFSTSILDP